MHCLQDRDGSLPLAGLGVCHEDGASSAKIAGSKHCVSQIVHSGLVWRQAPAGANHCLHAAAAQPQGGEAGAAGGVGRLTRACGGALAPLLVARKALPLLQVLLAEALLQARNHKRPHRWPHGREAMASNGDSWFRSSPMDYVQMYIPADAAEDIVRKLGDDREGVIQFVDVSMLQCPAS